MPQTGALSCPHDLPDKGHGGRGKGLGDLTDACAIARFSCTSAQPGCGSPPDFRDGPVVESPGLSG